MQIKTIHNPAYASMVRKLRLGRLNIGLTQVEAGRMVGKSRAWIQKIEACEVRLCPIGLIHLSQAYRLSATKLLRELEEELDDSSSSLSVRGQATVWGPWASIHISAPLIVDLPVELCLL